MRVRLRPLAPLRVVALDSEVHAVPLAALAPGVHVHGGILFRLEEDGSVAWAISRVCDHNGGTLIPQPDGRTAICPLHGWTLDLRSLDYRNVAVSKRQIPFEVDHGVLHYHLPERLLVMPARRPEPARVVVRFLAHACALFDMPGVRLVTDPWLVGPCFTTGWWHAYPPKDDALELLRSADLLYISHNHPDHLHGETLALLPRDIPIITPAFGSGSSARLLHALGFTAVHALPFNVAFGVEGTALSLAVLKSGDFRDDSGLYLTMGDFSALLTVDSNNLNGGVLPRNVDLMMTSFAGGASGFPLCAEFLSLEQQLAVIRQFRRATLRRTLDTIRAVRPRIYMPYAGYFSEAARRDRFIKTYNRKNAVEDVLAMASSDPGAPIAVNPLLTDELTFEAGAFTAAVVDRPRLYAVDDAYIQPYLDAFKSAAAEFSIDCVETYFVQSGFRSNLILYLQPTDDDFAPTDAGLVIDFAGAAPRAEIVMPDQLRQRFATAPTRGPHVHVLLQVRRESLHHVVRTGAPWEDLSIGFQCRINRTPDVYENDFWYHFTNIYIGHRAATPARTPAPPCSPGRRRDGERWPSRPDAGGRHARGAAERPV